MTEVPHLRKLSIYNNQGTRVRDDERTTMQLAHYDGQVYP